MTGNNFTPVNSPTQTTDTCTNNAAVLSPLWTDTTLSNGNLKAVATGNAYQWAISSIAIPSSGKWTCEFQSSNINGSSLYGYIGIAQMGNHNNKTGTSNRWGINLGNGEVYNGSGTEVHDFSTSSYATTLMRLEYDADADTIKIFSAGSEIFPASTGASATVGLTGQSSLHFFCAPYGSGADFTATFKGLSGTPTSGYLELNTTNLLTNSTPAIKDPDDHFKEVIVDHDGSSTNFTIPWSTYNGTSGTYDTLFSIKRLADEKWFVIDSIRGLNKYFSWNATTSQTTDANVLSVSGTTGTLGSTLADDNYLVQMYRLNAQSSRDTSNSEGSITGGSNSLIISANATAGWAVCTYTGTGSAGTFGHGLSQAPEWIRWYNTVSADGQTVYHAFNSSTPKDHYGNFDSAPTTLTNDDSTKFNDTAPTPDVNSVGSADSTNGSSDAMWCFSVHSVNSFSKVGAFVGNGGADGPFAEASISPKSVVLKNANGNATGDDWILVTDTRFLYNGDASTLAFNLTATEQATNLFDMLSNGIKLRTTNAAVNENNNTIVYHMIGSPFAGTTPATAR